MKLTRHETDAGVARWALNGEFLVSGFRLGDLLAVAANERGPLLAAGRTDEVASGPLLAPLEDSHEVWASGVTYLNSRIAREAESSVADVYGRVYHAQRPELFFKANGWRVIGPERRIAVRRDSSWNVPEPELVLVISANGEIVGYTVGNDVSSRSIEGENPLYLPQAKVYDASCAMGPAIVLATPEEISDLEIAIEIERAGVRVFSGESGIKMMKRTPSELVEYLYRELTFPLGGFLFTGTGIVPDESFTLHAGDLVTIRIGDLELRNPVAAHE